MKAFKSSSRFYAQDSTLPPFCLNYAECFDFAGGRKKEHPVWSYFDQISGETSICHFSYICHVVFIFSSCSCFHVFRIESYIFILTAQIIISSSQVVFDLTQPTILAFYPFLHTNFYKTVQQFSYWSKHKAQNA